MGNLEANTVIGVDVNVELPRLLIFKGPVFSSSSQPSLDHELTIQLQNISLEYEVHP